MARSAWGLGLVIVAIVVGCRSGEPFGEVHDRYRPRIDALRARLAALHPKVPPYAVRQQATLSPAPVYLARRGGGVEPATNTDFLAVEQLLDVTSLFPVRLYKGDFEPILTWTHTERGTPPDQRVGVYTAQTFDRALSRRYLVVYRGREARTSIGGSTYSGGELSLDAFVVDLASDTIVAATSARGTPGGDIKFQTRTGEDRHSQAYSAINSDAKTALIADLQKNLADVTGGTFTF